MLTVERSPCASDLKDPFPGILRLPDTVDPIKCRVMEVEDRIAGTGEGIVLQTTDGKVAGSVQEWLVLGAI